MFKVGDTISFEEEPGKGKGKILCVNSGASGDSYMVDVSHENFGHNGNGYNKQAIPTGVRVWYVHHTNKTIKKENNNMAKSIYNLAKGDKIQVFKGGVWKDRTFFGYDTDRNPTRVVYRKDRSGGRDPQYFDITFERVRLPYFVTLEDGTKVQLSKESYEALAAAVSA